MTPPAPTALLNNRPQLRAPHRAPLVRLPERLLEAPSGSAQLRAPSRTALGRLQEMSHANNSARKVRAFFPGSGLFFLPSFLVVGVSSGCRLPAGSARPAQQCPLRAHGETQPVPSTRPHPAPACTQSPEPKCLHPPLQYLRERRQQHRHPARTRGDTWQGRHKPGPLNKANTGNRFYPCQLSTAGWVHRAGTPHPALPWRPQGTRMQLDITL